MAEKTGPTVNSERDEYIRVLDSLFAIAFAVSPFDAICSVLRVGGMADANWDPFEESRNAMDDYNWMLDTTLAKRGGVSARRVGLLMYCQAVEMTGPHKIIANLLRCKANKNYVLNPFLDLGHFKKGKLFSWIPPSAKQKLQQIKRLALDEGQSELAAAIDKFFDERVRNAFSHSDYIFTDENFRFTEGGLSKQIELEDLDHLISDCFAFYGAFLFLHKHWLRALGTGRKFHKWPQYEVLELLATEEEGLYGFHVHFSNGSRATYTRRRSGIEAINLWFNKNGEIGFMIGSLDELQQVWKINGTSVEDWDALP